MINVTELKAHMYDVIGAIHEVHSELGAGLNEVCYQEGLQMQLEEQGISYTREQSFHPVYHNKEMNALFRIDFLCKGDIIVECKSVSELVPAHRAQLFNYMRLLKTVECLPFASDDIVCISIIEITFQLITS